jgi:hypothetical protein
MAVALAAMFIALGGTGYAATQLASQRSEARHDLTALKKYLAANAVPNAKHASVADHASTAGQATTASLATVANSSSQASNALSLGGIAASGYTLRDCASQTGQVKGFAYVPASASFSSTFVEVANSYNCSGQAVEARRYEPGGYEVKFVGSPVTIAVGSSYASAFGASLVFDQVGPGDFLVHSFNGSGGVDGPFAVLTP